ncbi:acetyltransferase [Flavobacterium enshiense]|uniref:acetyltransferase n=1 Tax=Flavobacterium enshiense TaxID=1341165 RepID=UPI00345DD44E
MYLYGASGHAKVVLDILSRLGKSVSCILDDAPKVASLNGVPVKKTSGADFSGTEEVIITIGNNGIREKIANRIQARYFVAVHPSAIISPSATVGEGSVVMPNAVINADSCIGKHCIINSGAIVEHDCVIADFVHVSPGAALAGNVTVGKGTQIGIGSCVIQGIIIGENVIVGAGTVVVKDIPDFSVVVGNPGKIIKTNTM